MRRRRRLIAPRRGGRYELAGLPEPVLEAATCVTSLALDHNALAALPPAIGGFGLLRELLSLCDNRLQVPRPAFNTAQRAHLVRCGASERADPALGCAVTPGLVKINLAQSPHRGPHRISRRSWAGSSCWSASESPVPPPASPPPAPPLPCPSLPRQPALLACPARLLAAPSLRRRLQFHRLLVLLAASEPACVPRRAGVRKRLMAAARVQGTCCRRCRNPSAASPTWSAPAPPALAALATALLGEPGGAQGPRSPSRRDDPPPRGRWSCRCRTTGWRASRRG